MTFVFIILILVLIFILVSRKEEKWMKHGRFVGSSHVIINGHQYYIEEVTFKGYQEALHKYYKIVADVAAYGEALEVKYDLYDWSYSIFRFEDTTIEVKHLRSFNKVQLIKSSMPLSIVEYEKDNAGYKGYYQIA